MVLCLLNSWIDRPRQFDSKPVSDFFQADSEDEDESSTVPRPPENDAVRYIAHI
jgi:hypothetical protein